MIRYMKDLVGRTRAKAAIRRNRALHKAVAERRLRETQEGSIWRSGEGGAHHDR
jgi:hypothetical protein